MCVARGPLYECVCVCEAVRAAYPQVAWEDEAALLWVDEAAARGVPELRASVRSQGVEAEDGVDMHMASSGAPSGRVRVAMEAKEREGLNVPATRATLLAICKVGVDRKARMQAGLDGAAAK